MIVEILAVVGVAALGVVGAGKTVASWYRVVPTSEAHLVTNRNGMKVYTSDKKGIAQAAEGNAYYEIPESIPYFGCRKRKMDLTIKEVNGDQIAYEKGQARFKIDWSLKYRITDVMMAAETSSSDDELKRMLVSPIEAAVNSVTTNYDVTQLRSSKIEIQNEIKALLEDDLAAWGLDLVSFQLGEFRDTNDSTIISDISKRTEAKINSETRIYVADRQKEAKVKEAEAAEIAGKREIEKESKLATERELMKQQVADKNRETQVKEAEVERTKVTKAAEIAKEKANIEAKMRNEVADLRKIEIEKTAEAAKIKAEKEAEADKNVRILSAEADAKEVELEAEADAKSVELEATARAKSIELEAGAKAKEIELKGAAEAAAKEKMAAALKQFDEAAVYAMTAELQIQANKEIGIESARALSQADVKAFIGGSNSFAFDIGALLTSFGTANPDAGKALMNKIAKPNDLGVNAVIDVTPETVKVE